MTQRISHSTRAIRERAALHVAGSLSEADRTSFEKHLHAGCEVCVAEVAKCAQAVPLLAEATALTPPAHLRAKVLARVAAERILTESPVVDRDGQRFVRSDGLAWGASHLRGVDVKTLLVDRERQRITRIVRMAVGAAIPPHRHGGVEESYLLEGEVMIEGVLMHSGDYCRAEPGSVHRQVRSASGCVLLVTSALTDEFLPESDAG